ncbi:MAG: serine kinase [Firmicutes bacterium]|nr:hypothetical protein [Dethiobacter sp.]MBS3888937.1 serine kinase [Bacillota bacterium]
MILGDVVSALQLEVLSGQAHLGREISGGYVSDMLSDVLAHAATDCLWVTRQAHANVIAVASLLGLSAIIVVNCPVSASVVDKAKNENLVLLKSNRVAFELVGELYNLGLRGCKRE